MEEYTKGKSVLLVVLPRSKTQSTLADFLFSRQLSANKVVAIKVLDIDDADFHAYGDQKDEQIRDFNREIRILRQAQESGAENLNQIIEALPVHSQLWLICEYCPGGSVKTLVSLIDAWIIAWEIYSSLSAQFANPLII